MSEGQGADEEESRDYPDAGQYWTDKEGYSGSHPDHLLEQYLSYVEMATRTSNRRVKINRFYVSVLSVLFVSISVVPRVASSGGLTRIVIFSVLIFGVLLCFVWFLNIESYSRLNNKKYHLAHEAEEQLPYSFYKAEWESDELKEGSDFSSYIPHARLEQAVPVIVSIPYLIVLGRMTQRYIPLAAIFRGLSIGVFLVVIILISGWIIRSVR